MAHLEVFWHPWHDMMTVDQLVWFKRAMPNQAHQQIVLDKVWNVEFDSYNTQIFLSFPFSPSSDVCIALGESGFVYNGYKMAKKVEEEKSVRMCDIYAKSI